MQLFFFPNKACDGFGPLPGCVSHAAHGLQPRVRGYHHPNRQPAGGRSARQQLPDPPPSKSRYMAIHSLSDWENPYLTVQQNMATLHLTQADANPSQLGTGGCRVPSPRAAGPHRARQRPARCPRRRSRELMALWPRGCHRGGARHAGLGPSRGRRNVEAAIKTLGDMGVVVYEWPEAGLR